MTIHLTYIVNRWKWRQKVHDINNFMVKYFILSLYYIILLNFLNIYIFQVQNSLQCASASAWIYAAAKKVLFRNLKFVSWYANILSAPQPHDGSNWSLFISFPFQLFLFWPGFQSLALKLQALHIFVLIGSAARGSELIGQIAGGCGSA